MIDCGFAPGKSVFLQAPAIIINAIIIPIDLITVNKVFTLIFICLNSQNTSVYKNHSPIIKMKGTQNHYLGFLLIFKRYPKSLTSGDACYAYTGNVHPIKTAFANNLVLPMLILVSVLIIWVRRIVSTIQCHFPISIRLFLPNSKIVSIINSIFSHKLPVAPAITQLS